MGSRIIVSLSSDIGLALADRWLAQGHEVAGTFRTRAEALDAVESRGALLVPCDLRDDRATERAAASLMENRKPWDVLVLAAGVQDPVGSFANCSFDEWSQSLTVNFTNQLRLIHALLPCRAKNPPDGAMVLLFAGGGTNTATVNYSAYTVSKIALIKTCELLHAEIPDTRFAILGPGWVKTKIHRSTLDAGARAGDNYRRTIDKLAGEDCVPMDKVVECCDWMISLPREVIGGRNISCAWDRWGTPELERLLAINPDMYRLRREGNDRLVRPQPLSGRPHREAE